jgi:hypothetical protein
LSQSIERINPRPRAFTVADEDRTVEVWSYRFHDNYWAWREKVEARDAKPSTAQDRGMGLYIARAVKPGDKTGPYVQVYYGRRDAYVRDGYMGAFDGEEKHAGRLRWWGETEENPKGGEWTFFPEPGSYEVEQALARMRFLR